MILPSQYLGSVTVIIPFWKMYEKFSERKTAIATIVFSSTNTFEGAAHIEGKKDERECNYFVRDGKIEIKKGEPCFIIFSFINLCDNKKMTFYFELNKIGSSDVYSSQGGWWNEKDRGAGNALLNFVSEEFKINQ